MVSTVKSCKMHQNTSQIATASIHDLVAFCNNCGQCSQACPTHFIGIFNPMGILRSLTMNGAEYTITHQPLFNCLTCNRCMSQCPNSMGETGMNFALVVRELRRIAWDQKLNIPQKAENPGICAVFNTEPEKKGSKKDRTVHPLVKAAGTDLQCATHGEIAYFIGDLPVLEGRISSDEVNHELRQIPLATIQLLNKLQIVPVVLDLPGSGHDDLWLGDSATFKRIAGENVNAYLEAGVRTIIVEEAEAYRTWKVDYPAIIPEAAEFEIVHLSEFLVHHSELVSSMLKFETLLPLSYCFLDSSRLGRLGGNVYEPPRHILTQIKGVELIELEWNRENAYDSEWGLHLKEDPAVIRMWEQRFEAILQTGADYVITTSPKALVHYYRMLERISEKDVRDKYPIMRDWAVFLHRLVRQ